MPLKIPSRALSFGIANLSDFKAAFSPLITKAEGSIHHIWSVDVINNSLFSNKKSFSLSDFNWSGLGIAGPKYETLLSRMTCTLMTSIRYHWLNCFNCSLCLPPSFFLFLDNNEYMQKLGSDFVGIKFPIFFNKDKADNVYETGISIDVYSLMT